MTTRQFFLCLGEGSYYRERHGESVSQVPSCEDSEEAQASSWTATHASSTLQRRPCGHRRSSTREPRHALPADDLQEDDQVAWGRTPRLRQRWHSHQRLSQPLGLPLRNTCWRSLRLRSTVHQPHLHQLPAGHGLPHPHHDRVPSPVEWDGGTDPSKTQGSSGCPWRGVDPQPTMGAARTQEHSTRGRRPLSG